MPILSSADVNRIYKDVALAFGEQGKMKFNFGVFKTQIAEILAQMQVTAVSKTKYYNNKPMSYISYEMNKQVVNRNQLAAQGYLLIFKFREYLLNETLTYRYYFHNSDGNIMSRNFGDDSLLNFIDFTERGLILNSQRLIAQEELKGRAEYLSNMTKYFNEFANDPNKMRLLGYYNLRKVRRSIKEKYAAMNSGLMQSINKRKYQVFNEGHIFESLDLSLTYQLMYPENATNMEQVFFGRFLKRDTVIGSKGGDNFLINASIKSNNASLYSYNTISNQLYLINMILNTQDPQVIKQKIIHMFLNNSDKANLIQKDIEAAAQQATDKLLLEIQQNLTSFK